MDKVVAYIYTHTMEYYSAIRKNKIMPFAARRMDLGTIILSDVSQTEGQIYDITYVVSKKVLFIKQK